MNQVEPIMKTSHFLHGADYNPYIMVALATEGPAVVFRK
jgi:hypothetical protein